MCDAIHHLQRGGGRLYKIYEQIHMKSKKIETVFTEIQIIKGQIPKKINSKY